MPIGQPKAPEPKATGTPKRNTGAKTLGSSAKTQAREEGLAGIGQLGTAVCVMTKNFADAGALEMHSRPIAHELAMLAEDNEKMGDIVDKITAMGPYAALISATMPLVIQLLINHNRLDEKAAGLFGEGVMSKEALAKKVSGDMEKRQAAFLAEAEAAKAAA